MGTFTNMIKQAQKEYDLGEREMWNSISILDEIMDSIKESNPELADKATMKYIGLLYKGHFPLDFAVEVVNELHSKDADGRNMTGKHWTLEQINETARAKRISFPSHTTDGDKLYAFNSFWHDVHLSGASEEQIFDEAYQFYFNDEDYTGEWGKPFKYYHAMNE